MSDTKAENNIRNLFGMNNNRQQVFNTILRLSQHNPNLVLLYREGRRADDDFITTPLEIEPYSFDRIRYSNEWRMIDPSNSSKTSGLSFHFRDDRLHRLTVNEDDFSIFVPLSLNIYFWLKQPKHSFRNLLFKRGGDSRADLEDWDIVSSSSKEKAKQRRYGDQPEEEQ